MRRIRIFLPCPAVSENLFVREGTKKGMSRLNEKLKFRVSAEEVERIKVKMEDVGILNMSAYIRKMALDGICVRMDLGDVRQLVILLR